MLIRSGLVLAVVLTYLFDTLKPTQANVAEAGARAQGAKTVCLHVRRGAKGVRRLYELRGSVADPSGDRDLLLEVYPL